MFVFHRMSGASGAGPAEKRVKPESPCNCGHSYWSKLPYLAELPFAGASEAAFTLPIFGNASKVGKINSKTSTVAIVAKESFGLFILSLQGRFVMVKVVCKDFAETFALHESLRKSLI
jgi:hypothetical protein